MGTVIGITGTPGTGKKSIAPRVAESLRLPCLAIPALGSRGAPGGAHETAVDTEKAKLEFSRNPPVQGVFYGHLLPYVLPPALTSKVVVLRCEPEVLKARLSERGYPAGKVRENVEAELIGLIAHDTRKAYGARKTVEFDATASSIEAAAGAIVALLRSRPAGIRPIDWTINYPSAQKLEALFSPP